MFPYRIKTEDNSAEQIQQQLSNAINSHSSTGASITTTSNGSAPSNDANVDVSQKMPKNYTDRNAPPQLPAGAAGANQHHPVAEFLYQLTKMLTDDNSEIIEWVDGRIKVHYPERLESEVLHKYFRHSKFASFQRQLNYFNFRKIAGKGKMSPCSYINESATSDIRSLLLIKRKTNGSAARKAMEQHAAALGGTLNSAFANSLPGIAAAQSLAFGNAVGLQALTQQLQLQNQSGLIDHTNPLSQLLMQNQRQQSFADLQHLGGLKPTMPSFEQIHAQLARLTNQQNQVGGASAALNAAAFNLASVGTANTALGSAQLLSSSSDNPATAALNASSSATASMPATAAMNMNSDGQISNLFESATNLKALIGNDHSGNDAHKAAAAVAGLNRLPSSTGMFQGSISNASLGNLLASSNRLSSLLSLNSFLSREPSLADFAMMPNGAAQYAAFQHHQQQQPANIVTSSFEGQNTSS